MLGYQEVKFLGHILSSNGVRPDPEKTVALRRMRESSNVNKLWSFLRIVNQLGKFIPHLAEKDKHRWREKLLP